MLLGGILGSIGTGIAGSEQNVFYCLTTFLPCDDG